MNLGDLIHVKDNVFDHCFSVNVEKTMLDEGHLPHNLLSYS